MNTENFIPAEGGATPEVLLQTLRFLVFRYSRRPSPIVAGRIAACLDRLLAHPQLDALPDERCVYRQMRTYWRLVENLG
jgi:hypothetical protein